MRRLFVDMDGTLAKWQSQKQLEDLYQPRYFATLPPQQPVIDAVRRIMETHSDAFEVYILSAILSDSKYAVPEKNEWLDRFLPEIGKGHRLFVPAGISKPDAVSGKIEPDDTLLDDYTLNLLDWSAYGRGVKLLNGINHTRGTWQGARVHMYEGAEQIVKTILGEG